MIRRTGWVVAGVAAVTCLGGGTWFASRAGWFGVAQQPSEEPGQPKRPRDQFAADRALPDPLPFDSQRAMGYLKQLCDIGPRLSGSAGMKKQQELLQKHFENLGGQVAFQRFTARQRSRPNDPVEMANLVVVWRPEAKNRVIFCGHYDTRPIADQEPRRSDWDRPFVSANDGTSTVAWLMELAHAMKDAPLNVGVDFVIFDGEEYVFDPSPGGDRYFFGSEHFADEYRRTPPAHRYQAAVLLDLFAGKNAKFPRDRKSNFHAGFVVDSIWATAAKLGVPAFDNELAPGEILDDHVALIRVGIPAVDVIDFSYPHWHRLSDRPENCSPETMAQVARVLTVWVQLFR
jgi:hypothetical protein